MGKKRQGGNDGGGAGSKGRPNWTPYLAVAAVVLAIAVFLTVPGDTNTEPAKAVPSGPSAADLEGELRRLVAGLGAVAGRGGSGLFGKIQAMADQAQAVLAEADAATSEADRKRILQEGLASKSKWMATLQDHAVGLKQEDQEAASQEAAAPQAGGAVVALVRNNFTSFVAANPHTMVQFYAPWCPHCRKFAPEYAACAEGFTDRAAFAIVDGEKETQLTRVYGVGGYPTLKWMIHGRAIEYAGPRTKEKLAEWVEERLKPAYVDLDSVDDAAAALEQGGGKQAKICAGEGKKGSRQYQAFVDAAERFRSKIIFTWSPPARTGAGDGSLRLHSSGQVPHFCGAEVDGVPKAGACQTGDEVIAWLEDRFTFDPDLE